MLCTPPPPPLRLLPARPPPHPPLQRPLTQSNWPQQSGRRSRWWCSCMHEKGGGCGSCRSGPALHAPPTHPAHAQAAMHPTRSSHLSTHTRTTHQLKHAPARLARPSPRSSCGGVCVCARVGRWGTRRAGNCAMTACHPSTHPTHPAPPPRACCSVPEVLQPFMMGVEFIPFKCVCLLACLLARVCARLQRACRKRMATLPRAHTQLHPCCTPRTVRARLQEGVQLQGQAGGQGSPRCGSGGGGRQRDEHELRAARAGGAPPPHAPALLASPPCPALSPTACCDPAGAYF